MTCHSLTGPLRQGLAAIAAPPPPPAQPQRHARATPAAGTAPPDARGVPGDWWAPRGGPQGPPEPAPGEALAGPAPGTTPGAPAADNEAAPAGTCQCAEPGRELAVRGAAGAASSAGPSTRRPAAGPGDACAEARWRAPTPGGCTRGVSGLLPGAGGVGGWAAGASWCWAHAKMLARQKGQRAGRSRETARLSLTAGRVHGGGGGCMCEAGLVFAEGAVMVWAVRQSVGAGWVPASLAREAARPCTRRTAAGVRRRPLRRCRHHCSCWARSRCCCRCRCPPPTPLTLGSARAGGGPGRGRRWELLGRRPPRPCPLGPSQARMQRLALPRCASPLAPPPAAPNSVLLTAPLAAHLPLPTVAGPQTRAKHTRLPACLLGLPRPPGGAPAVHHPWLLLAPRSTTSLSGTLVTGWTRVGNLGVKEHDMTCHKESRGSLHTHRTVAQRRKSESESVRNGRESRGETRQSPEGKKESEKQQKATGTPGGSQRRRAPPENA
jgi:hypothetical protein